MRFPANIRLGEDVLKTSWRRLEDFFSVTFFCLLSIFIFFRNDKNWNFNASCLNDHFNFFLMSNCQKWRSKVKKRSWTNNGMFSQYFTSCRFQFAKRPPCSGRMQENTDQKHSKYGHFFTQWSSKRNFFIVLLIQIGFHVTLMLLLFFFFVEKSLEKKDKTYRLISW